VTRQQVPNYELARDTARANLLVNGGFEIWQRGNGPFTANYGPDRWLVAASASDTISVSKDTTNVDATLGSVAAAACTFTLSGGAGNTQIYQILKPSDNYGLLNRAVSFSVRVRTATANAVRIAVYNGASVIYSGYHTGDGTWQTLSVSTTMSGTLWQVNVFFVASCTAYLDNAMLVVGSVAADYTPLHPADDLARCLRYYEARSYPSNNYIALGQAFSTTQIAGVLPGFLARKAVTPTITIAAGGVGTLALTSSAFGVNVLTTFTPTASSPDAAHFVAAIGPTVLVAGNASVLMANTGQTAQFLIEANP
jgi:hypothetical protein